MNNRYYFKSYYQPCGYSPNWYGLLNYAPPATVLLYNDVEGYCVGYMEEHILSIQHITQEEAEAIIAAADTENPDVWTGERLAHRWDAEEPEGVE